MRPSLSSRLGAAAAAVTTGFGDARRELFGRGDVRLSYYAVAFVDCLGQQDQLLKLKALPKTPAEGKAAIETIRSSAGVVHTLRETFAQFVEVAQKSRPVGKHVPRQHRALFKKLRSKRIEHRGFSDSFVITVPLYDGGNQEDTAKGIGAVWTALFGVAGLSLVAMSQRIPLRAGVEVGLGLDIFPKEVYGPVMVKAYKLESEVADYPRAVVGPTLLEYISLIEKLLPDSVLNKYALQQAKDCRQLICVDRTDGQSMLHPLSPFMFELMPKFVEFREPAQRWVIEQESWFRREGNGKLAGRYARLSRYFAEHSH